MRTPNPELAECIRVALQLHRVGRDRAITGEDLRHALEPAFPGLIVRRIQEAIRELRRQGHPIASSSSAGYWFEPDARAFRKAMRKELIPRIRRLAEDLTYTDRHLLNALNRALEGV